MSLDYKIYKELGKSYLNDIRKGIKNLSYKTILPLTLASTMALYACGGGSSGGGSSGGGGNPAIYQCNDNKDNDSDGLKDYPSDLGCSSLTDDDEYNAPGNQAPVALASFLYSNPDNSYHPTYVHPGDAAVFDGTNSYDPDSSPNALTYNWSLILKPICSALTSSNINPNQDSNIVGINPDCIGNYTLELTVSDGLDTGSDTVVQSVVDNNPPVADAGNDIGTNVDVPVLIDGSNSSDSDGIISECQFTFEDNGQVYTETSSSAPDGLFDCKVLHTLFIQNTNCRDPPTCSVYGWKVDLQVKDDDNANSNIDTAYIRVDP